MHPRHVALALLALVLVASLSACAGSGGSEASKVKGFVVSSEQASITAEPDLRNPDWPGVLVTRVVAPGPAFIVVFNDEGGQPGGMIATATVPKGESRNVGIQFGEMPVSSSVIVRLLADKGMIEQFEYDPKKAETSMDRPYFVGTQPVQVVVAMPR